MTKSKKPPQHKQASGTALAVGIGLFVIAIVLAIEAILSFGTFAVAVAFWPWIGSHQPLTADQLLALSRSAAWSFLEGPLALILGWIGKQFLTR